MIYLLVRYRVKDFHRWKPIHDDDLVVRKNSGCRNEEVYQSMSTPNEITILYEWDQVGNAEIYIESQGLRDTLQRAGVVGQPEVYYLNQIQKKKLTTGRASWAA